jgi:hypothetical protein
MFGLVAVYEAHLWWLSPVPIRLSHYARPSNISLDIMMRLCDYDYGRSHNGVLDL